MTVIVSVFGAALLANNLNFGRVAPVFPLLLIMTGVFLESVYWKLDQWISKIFTGRVNSRSAPIKVQDESRKFTGIVAGSGKAPEGNQKTPKLFRQFVINVSKIERPALNYLVVVVFMSLITYITFANLASLKRMSTDEHVINEYINDDYSVCAPIGNISVPGQRVYIYSPDDIVHCSADPHEGWYLNGKQLEIHNIEGQFISPDALVPGDLIVVGVRNRSLSNGEISLLINLGSVTNSLPSLQSFPNIAGITTTASICFQCNQLAPKR